MYAQTIIIIIVIVMELDHSLISVSCLGIHKAPPVNHKIGYYILILDITRTSVIRTSVIRSSVI